MYQIKIPPPGTAVGKTTLAAAITSTQQTLIQLTTTTITVGPYTTVTATNPEWGLIIDGEVMAVISPIPSTANFLNVARGRSGTSATLHGVGATVWAAPMQNLPAVNPVLTGEPPRQLRYYSPLNVGNNFAVLGTSSTVAANNYYFTAIDIPNSFVATGLANLNGTTAGTSNSCMAIYDPAGNLVAQTNQVTVATANAYQNHAFPNTILLTTGRYFVAYQQNGTTATPMLMTGGVGLEYIACNNANNNSTLGFNNFLPSITVPTVFNNNTGPWVYVY